MYRSIRVAVVAGYGNECTSFRSRRGCGLRHPLPSIEGVDWLAVINSWYLKPEEVEEGPTQRGEVSIIENGPSLELAHALGDDLLNLCVELSIINTQRNI